MIHFQSYDSREKDSSANMTDAVTEEYNDVRKKLLAWQNQFVKENGRDALLRAPSEMRKSLH